MSAASGDGKAERKSERPVHRDTVEYWKAVTAEDRPVHSDHPAPKESVFAKYLSRLEPMEGQRILDVGIGFGRFVPLYLSHGLEVHGVDIDPEMVEALRDGYPDQPITVGISPAEKLGYADETFDMVVCWGVFDELDQGPSLAEMARVLKTGGRVLLTGKNVLYHADDSEALTAEVNARAKHHPNFFTDVANTEFDRFGLSVKLLTRFERRGDFAAQRHSDSADERAPFYEFVLVAQKIHAPEFEAGAAPSISSSVSRTFEARNG